MWSFGLKVMQPNWPFDLNRWTKLLDQSNASDQIKCTQLSSKISWTFFHAWHKYWIDLSLETEAQIWIRYWLLYNLTMNTVWIWKFNTVCSLGINFQLCYLFKLFKLLRLLTDLLLIKKWITPTYKHPWWLCHNTFQHFAKNSNCQGCPCTHKGSHFVRAPATCPYISNIPLGFTYLSLKHSPTNICLKI